MTDFRPSDLKPLRAWARSDDFESVVGHVARRSLQARRLSLSLTGQLLILARPALAIAALIAIVVWTGSTMRTSVAPNTPVTTMVAPSTDGAMAMVRWARAGEVPSPWELFSLVGGTNEPR